MTTTQPTTATALFLLALKDDGHPRAWGQQTTYGLAGALLTDLVLAGRLAVSPNGKRLVVVDQTPTGDELLDEGLVRFAGRDGKRLASTIPPVAKGLDRVVGRYLARRGVVREEEGSLWGLVPTRFPLVDRQPEQQLRAQLAEVLRGGSPRPADLALVGLVHGLRLDGKVFRADELGMSRGDLRRRISDLAEGGDPGADATTAAIRRLNASAVPAMAACVGPAASC
ncbi:GOLPH3/VPS74 family protein [Arsenicicoccus dermatophilus]|uniref:GOLPH3/VPS74 family protein n=1 Tax=Arsenicicoccus dermatophilus TaxID=1076331 RepID=UPI003916DCDE